VRVCVCMCVCARAMWYLAFPPLPSPSSASEFERIRIRRSSFHLRARRLSREAARTLCVQALAPHEVALVRPIGAVTLVPRLDLDVR
jgi:hypothetical protein